MLVTKKMKQRSLDCCAFLVLLILFTHSWDLYARSLPNTQAQGQEEHYNVHKVNGNADSIVQMEEVMGVEACGSEEDVECLERRMISEAHLDYIYTQHHNKP